MEAVKKMVLVLALLLNLVQFGYGSTDPGDLAVINQFRDGLKNPELLKWPADDNPCGPPSWRYIYCSGNRVKQIQAKGLGLKGNLPQNLNQLSELTDLGLQQNEFTGKLPSLSGLSQLRRAYFDFNQFDTIPSDFFDGLKSLEVLALDYIPLNATTGWSLPDELQNSAQLTNLTLVNSNLAGPVPEFLGNMSSLQVLLLSKNLITGGIPATFRDSMLRMLWLNEQSGEGMTGPIDVISSMKSLTSLWLHGNHFSGKIPEDISNLVELHDLNLNGNNLVGLIPDGLASLPLQKLDLNNNQFMGRMPEFKGVNATYSSNPFCLKTPGAPCAPEVMALLDFLDQVNYPSRLVQAWSGNDPCKGSWFGLGCNLDKNKVITINLARSNLTGTLSPSIANLVSLTRIYLGSNNLSGEIPMSWTSLKSLVLLDLSNNNLSPPKPSNFSSSLHVTIDGNPLFTSSPPPAAAGGGGGGGTPPQKNNTSGDSPSPTLSPAKGSSSGTPADNRIKEGRSSKVKLVAILAPAASFAFLVLLVLPLSFYFYKKRKRSPPAPNSIVIHPRDSSDPDNMVKIVVTNNNTQGSVSSLTGSGSASINSGESHVIESGNLVISVQVLRNVTKNFAPENELGRGGFGVVYKGELDDGTKIAVKRMEAGVISSKALNEFHSEIAVLSKVRHKHLVSLLGYSTEGNERILVYEYMPQGALSKHLFHWKSFKLEPLSWKRRLNIALDVARGMEYLHTLAHQSFIHRDLKSSNILIGDDFRAKVSDFGLVKLAPDGDHKSVVTRLAGTFGYLAPEYAVTGKITTKADVFSYGVVLMELLTGLMALDEDRPEESQYLAAWFWHIKSNKEKLKAAIDPALDVKEKEDEEEVAYESISIVSDLAGHCTAREPSQRPDMGHVVNVLGSLVEKWKPLDDETEEYCGIDYSLPLTQMVKGWQESEGKDFSYLDLEDSKGSIPARPAGFAESFTSADGR